MANVDSYREAGITPDVVAQNRQPAERAENATLRKDEWEVIDDAVVGVMRERLTVVDALQSAGLVTNVGLGTIHRVVERLQDVGDAEVTMDGDTSPQRHRHEYASQTFPVPIISQDFRISRRQLEASRGRGSDLQTDNAEASGRAVREKMEDLVVNGITTFGPSGNGLDGLSTGSNELTVTLSNNWDTSSGTPVEDVESMLQTAYNNNLEGPFDLLIPKNYWATIQDDYKAEVETTIRDRFLRFVDINNVRPAFTLSDDNVLLVQMTSDVVDLTMGQEPTTIQWEKNPMVTNFKIFSVMSPAVKTIEKPDGTTLNGIVHLS